MKEYPHSSFIPSRGNDTRTPLSHGLRANLEPSAKHVIIKRNQCKGGISLLKKVLMTMALCAASAMPFVSDAKYNAGAQLPAQAEATQGKAEDTLKRPAFEDKRIEINLASRLLTLYQGDVGIRMYPVAPGKPDSPTPTGRRKVVEMEIRMIRRPRCRRGRTVRSATAGSGSAVIMGSMGRMCRPPSAATHPTAAFACTRRMSKTSSITS